MQNGPSVTGHILMFMTECNFFYWRGKEKGRGISSIRSQQLSSKVIDTEESVKKEQNSSEDEGSKTASPSTQLEVDSSIELDTPEMSKLLPTNRVGGTASFTFRCTTCGTRYVSFESSSITTADDTTCS
uniref:Uncharacterized protein n=1 Tax=Amphimedon queenslandica TaxID=400682 RepID=A0A1X7VRC8_AMPQE